MANSIKAGRKPRCYSLVSLGLALVLALSLAILAGSGTVSAADEVYKVQRGDNLTAIAARYGVTVEAISRANGIANVNNIVVGQSLKIPSASGAASNNGPQPATTGETAYIVQKGETLSGLASRFGVSQVELARLNKLSVMSFLYVGQTLRIPGTANVQPAATVAPTTAASTATPTAQFIAPTPTPMVTWAPTYTPLPPTPTALATVGPVVTTVAVQAQAVAPVANAQTSEYTVQRGDSLSSIAAKYGLSLDALQQANRLANPNLLFVGQKLLIPAAGTVVQPAAPTARPTTAPASNPPAPSQSGASLAAVGGKWIDVNLSRQRLTAYDGQTVVFSSLVSTGTSAHPTVTGTFNIYIKYTSQAMAGGSGREYYYLPGVPYVMYFYQSYALHGTYWHNNFGRQMSHGCVNLPTPAAKFIYGWAPMGTPVNIHY